MKNFKLVETVLVLATLSACDLAVKTDDDPSLDFRSFETFGELVMRSSR